MKPHQLLRFSISFLLLVVISFIVIPDLIGNLYSNPTDSHLRDNVIPVSILIVPHHELAKDLIIKGLSTIDNPQLILIGPRHHNTGRGEIATTTDWLIDGRNIVNQQLVASLINAQIATTSSDLATDQSLATPLKLLSSPKITIVPLLLNPFLSESEIANLVNWLGDNSNSTTISFSTDFSHYLDKDKADANDTETFTLLRTFNYQKIRNLSSDYTDCPACLIVFLKLLEKQHKPLQLLDHQNSYTYSGNYQLTTSYFLLSN